MKNTIIATITLFIAVIGAGIFYFSDLNTEQKLASKPLNYLPENTFFIATFINDETTDNIFRDFEIFDALLGFQRSEALLNMRNSLLRSPSLKPYFDGAEVFVSFHPVDNSIEVLYSISAQEKVKQNILTESLALLTADYQTFKLDTLDHTILGLHKGTIDSSLYLVYQHDVLFASYSKEVLVEILDPEINKMDKEQIDYFTKHTSRNTPLSVYLDHRKIKLLSDFVYRTKQNLLPDMFGDATGLSTWNINFKNDALILSGESTVEQENSYISLFANQTKTRQRLYQFFPNNTATYLELSIDDKSVFQKDLKNLFKERKLLDKLEDQLKATARSRSVDIRNDVNQCFGNEFALVEQSNGELLGFLNIRDSALFQKNKDGFVSLIQDSIYRFDQSNVLYALYGDIFQSFTRPYFIQKDDVLIIANQISTLTHYNRLYRSNQLLIGNLGFKNYQKTQGDEANVSFFSHTNNSSSLFRRLLKSDFLKKYQNANEYGYQDFYSWSFQLSGNESGFISNIYGIYKSKAALGSAPDWTYAFSHRPITQPFVFEHSDTSQFILAQEQDHTVHAISPAGLKMWSAVFHGRMVGSAIQLPDRTIIAVTDKRQLYRFHPDGKAIPGFSLLMPDTPSYHPSLLHVSGQDLIAVPSRTTIMLYTIDGKMIEGWKENQLEHPIVGALLTDGTHLIATTTDGSLYYFDIEGNVQKNIKVTESTKFNNGPGAVVSSTSDSLNFVNIDTAGNIFVYDDDHARKTTKLELEQENSIIEFADVRGDQSQEMILLDGNKLSISNVRASSINTVYNFINSITNRPQFFNLSGGKAHIGVASAPSRLLYLFDGSGKIVDGFPIEGLPNFYYGKINYNTVNYILCYRSDHKLYAFRDQ